MSQKEPRDAEEPREPSAAAPAPVPPAAPPVDPEELRERVLDVLRDTYDPEIPVNIYDLGLVYDVDVGPEGAVVLRMTLTSPACPVAGSLPGEVEGRVAALPGVASCRVELVWDPPWDPSKLSEAARLQLGLF